MGCLAVGKAPTTMGGHLGILDLGSNSVLLLVLQRDAGGGLREVLEPVRFTRLGEGMGHGRRLLPQAVDRTLAAMRELLALIPSGTHGVGLAAATSAVRDAANRSLFLDGCRALLGAEPLVLSGDEEAKSSFAGAAAGLPPDQFVVTVDTGGGSTQIAAGYPGECPWSVSLALGCVRLGERFGLYDVPAPGAVEAARTAVRQVLAPVVADLPTRCPAGGPVRVLATSGTAATFAAVSLKTATYDRARIHGFTATEPEVTRTAAELFTLTREQRTELPGITPGRAPVLPTGLIILSEIVRALGAPQLEVSCRGLRYGLALRLNRGEFEPNWGW